VITKAYKLPFYAKISLLLVGLLALIVLLYIAKSILIPLVFAILIAILLHPFVNFITRFKVKRVIAIIITLFLTFLIIASFCILLYTQASQFSESWPVLVDRCTVLLNQTIAWASKYFNINSWKIHQWTTKTQGDLINISSAAIGQTLVTIGNWLVILVLVPVYTFIILYYHPLIIEFIHRLFKSNNQHHVSDIVKQTKKVIQQYLKGLFIEAVIIAALNSIGLLIIGIDYAILLGILGALLNVIPYIGGLVAIALPVMVALATKSTAWFAVYVLAIHYFVQLIDNNYIVPKIVASKVKLNALFSILAVIVGNAIWGIAGMFLSIPLLAIIKLICDHIEPLKPWGFLMGDTLPPILRLKPILKKTTT